MDFIQAILQGIVRWCAKIFITEDGARFNELDEDCGYPG